MNKNKLIKFGLIALFVGILFVQLTPLLASAAVSDSVRPNSAIGAVLPGASRTDPLQIVIAKFIINILLPIAGSIAVLFVIIGGYQYMFAGLNEEMAESGKKTLQNAIIGLVIIILSYLIINVIINAIANSTV